MSAIEGGPIPVCEACTKKTESEVCHWPCCYKCGGPIVNSYTFEEGACWNGDICQTCERELREQFGPKPEIVKKQTN